MSDITANIESVHGRIQAAAERAGRSADEITLVAVTKTHPLETVVRGYEAGLRHFGENRAQEGHDKVAAMAEWLTGSASENSAQQPPIWHFIGHLQSRKVGLVLGQFKVIHSVDSLKLAERINRLARRDEFPTVEIFLECNVSGEGTKYGFPLDRWATDETQLEDFLEQVASMESLEKVTVQGLMTMAPWYDDPGKTRPTFQSLAALRQRLQAELPQFDWRHLSMGMTDDFEVAVEEGATIVRVGRALFGERNV